MWRWKYFEPKEVLSPEGIKVLAHQGLLLVQPALLDKLTELREKIEKPILINFGSHVLRGYRCPSENNKVEGKPFSLHLQGLAADVTVKDLSLYDLGQAALAVGFSGIGTYPEKNFLHLDLRTNLRWTITRWVG